MPPVAKFLMFFLTGVLFAVCPTFAQTLDSDGDGIADAQDACRKTPVGRPFVAVGCSALDVVQSPEVLVQPLSDALSTLAGRLRRGTDRSGTLSTLDNARAQFGLAMKQLRNGGVCAASETFSGGLRTVDLSKAALQDMVNAAMTALPSTRTRTEYADITDADTALLNLQRRLSEIDAVVVNASRAGGVLTSICRNSVNTSINGTIRRIDHNARRVELSNGFILGLADNLPPRRGLSPGMSIEATGMVLGDATGVAVNISGGISSSNRDLTGVKDCLQLRFVPIQNAPANGPYLLHHIEAYQYGNTYRMEVGMGLAVEPNGCPEQFQAQPAEWHGAEMFIEFTNIWGNWDYMQFGWGVDETSGVINFPLSVDPAYPATLHVSYVHDDISYPNGWAEYNNYKEIKMVDYHLQLYPRHGVCVAEYATRTFSLDDSAPMSFAKGMATGNALFAQGDPGTTTTFMALGYAVLGNNTTSYPNLQVIKDNEPFAVFAESGPDPYVSGTADPEAMFGTKERAGLIWPKVVGTRNGYQFMFSCALPATVRDQLWACQGTSDTTHRLPFTGGYPLWTLIQGNFGGFTHQGKQAYAFDMGAPLNTELRAARGGFVTFVREDQTGNSYSNPGCSNCSPNALVVEHSDGTETVYFHMPTNGVVPQVGDRIKRGDKIGVVGNTGYSTGPHVHVQAELAGDNTSISLNFQSYWPGTVALHNCYVPQPGDIMVSNQ